MSTVAARRRGTGDAEPRLQTIGAVCEALREEFPDLKVHTSYVVNSYNYKYFLDFYQAMAPLRSSAIWPWYASCARR